ncbi:hypothetical protein PIB30_072628 [Stylosanthes scabra]|uniref:Putative plant transposon protein domain-containing protein n=1 Tax=Stylosanthes scabra TaxID=79078 RepID=A0ABU6RPE7_9FABA|nr:hypothetical protein [Stylosanthes scabra]
MASSSAPVSVFDEHHFRKEFNQELFNSYAKKRKVISEVGFDLNEDEYPQIMEQVMLRGWKRLAASHTSVSKLLVQEFYANAAISDEEAVKQDELPYKSFVRGKEVDFSPSTIRRVMRFKRETVGAQTDYKTRQAMDQRLDETELHPLAKGWQEFIIHSLVPTGNKSEVTITRAILIHCIMRGEEVRAEDIIADNMAVIAQGLPNKGNLAFPSTIYKLCKDAGVPLREFRRTTRISELSYITARRMEAIRFPRNLPQPQQDDDDEDEPMPQADGGNNEEEEQQQPQQNQQPPQHGFPDFQPHYESQFHETLQGIESHLSSMQFFQLTLQEMRLLPAELGGDLGWGLPAELGGNYRENWHGKIVCEIYRRIPKSPCKSVCKVWDFFFWPAKITGGFWGGKIRR